MRQKKFWVIADTHFGHNKLVKEGLRPAGFEEKILENIWNRLEPGDILIHLGDVSFYKDEYWTKRLMGSLGHENLAWLLRGNHDNRSVSWYLDRDWDVVADTLLLEIYGQRILFSHEPLPADHYNINIHGHLHDLSHREDNRNPWHCLVQIEQTLAPVNLKHLIDTHLKERT